MKKTIEKNIKTSHKKDFKRVVTLTAFVSCLSCMALVPTAASASTMVEIVDIDVHQPEITVQGSNVRVVDASGLTLSIYNVAGVCVAQFKVDGPDKSFELNLPRGCYILKVGKVVRKISIK